MILDFDQVLEERPGNEGETHFLLKQIGRAWMWEALKLRIIATEVPGFWSSSNTGRDHRIWIKGKRLEKLLTGVCPYCGSVMHEFRSGGSERKICRWDGVYGSASMRCRRVFAEDEHGWSTQRREQRTRSIVDLLGIGKRVVQNEEMDYCRTEVWVTRGVEAKASLSDFRSGFCDGADFTYVIAPRNLIPVVEVPKGVGLVEVDFSRVRVRLKPVIGVDGVSLRRRASFRPDQRFESMAQHQDFVTKMMAAIAQRNTLENMLRGDTGCD